MRTKFFIIILFFVLQLKANNPGTYNIVWNSPGNSSKNSVPLGNGDMGINLWVEEEGNICFYLCKTDSWDENGRLIKIGKVKINISPNPFKNATLFTQILNLTDGTIEIKAGQGKEQVKFIVWVDANNPVVQFEAETPKTTEIIAKSEIWRTKADTIKDLVASDLNAIPEIYGPMLFQPDYTMNVPGKIVWYHLNPETTGFRTNLIMQGLYDFGLENPLKDRIFGAVIIGDKFEKSDETTLYSKGGKKRDLSIYVNTLHPSTPEKWLNSVDQIIEKYKNLGIVDRFNFHKDWWHKFWERSWVNISCNDTVTTPNGIESQGKVLTRGYALQRFINACAGRGKYPIKFNGSIFTVDYEGMDGFADYRLWGPGYWWQNSRLPYISMPASGDFEMMEPLFNMYLAQLPLAKYRTNIAFKHKGALFPECTYFWGSVFSVSWGFKHIDVKEEKLQESRWHKYEWVCGLELASMMYDYYLYTRDEKFAKEKFLPFTEQVILFFEQHYNTDTEGNLKLEPSQALETWWICTNSTPEVAGLHYLVEKVASMPQYLLSDSLKLLIAKVDKILPPLPVMEVNNKKMLAPAEKFADYNNVEAPELYPVFPFKLYGSGKPDIDLAINAYYSRNPKGSYGWRQDDIFAALLGLTSEAKTGILERASKWDKEFRFPAFWGPNYDGTPDQCHGGVLLKSLQVMLLQCDDREIRLLPAWPKEWDVDFKLSAPYNTTIEVDYKQNKIVRLKVTPEERSKDIILPDFIKMP